jgi:glycosyltransferase involved in cell wall biosynthesis
MIATIVFWTALAGVAYAYLGYPLVLRVLAHVSPNRSRAALVPGAAELPSVTVIVPVHNEAPVIERKIANTLAIDYPRDRLEVLVVSDGSTDRTVEIARSFGEPRLRVLELESRGGKARALNHGLAHASGEIVCFTDASIMLETGALRELVANFGDAAIGCASGEDAIEGDAGEGLYGRYELALRRLESRVHSIVGASGSFYAQRRALCGEFREGLAPDFLSVLNTVEQGFRAICDPRARGTMTSLGSSRAEFQRKVRTILRGISTLFVKRGLLDPFRHGVFAFELVSHKLMRWCVPFFLIAILVSNLFLLNRPLYLAFFAGQLAFYGLGTIGSLHVRGVESTLPGRIATFFVVVNAATLVAWAKFAAGVRQEVWAPTRRESTET